MSYTSTAGPNIYTLAANTGSIVGANGIIIPFVPAPAGAVVAAAPLAQGLTVDSTSVFAANGSALQCQLSGLYSINWRLVGSTATANSIDSYLQVTRYGIGGLNDGAVPPVRIPVILPVGQNCTGYTAITTVGSAKASGSAVVYLNSADIIGVYAHSEAAMNVNRASGAGDIVGSYIAIERLA
jgi:hypothetical protein